MRVDMLADGEVAGVLKAMGIGLSTIPKNSSRTGLIFGMLGHDWY
jgi:hypothetical protein